MNIIWGCRNLVKVNQAKEELSKEFPDAQIWIIELDLASFSSITKFTANLGQISTKIDYFYHNAGVYHLDKSYTQDGLDLTLETYYLNELVQEYLSQTNQKTKFILSFWLSKDD